MSLLKKFYADESGATVIEYGLIVAFVTVVALTALLFINKSFDDMYTSISRAFEEAMN